MPQASCPNARHHQSSDPAGVKITAMLVKDQQLRERRRVGLGACPLQRPCTDPFLHKRRCEMGRSYRQHTCKCRHHASLGSGKLTDQALPVKAEVHQALRTARAGNHTRTYLDAIMMIGGVRSNGLIKRHACEAVAPHQDHVVGRRQDLSGDFGRTSFARDALNLGHSKGHVGGCLEQAVVYF